jgi:hypothetical protein
MTSDYLYPADPRIPPVIRSLGLHYVSVQPKGVMLEFGGGFDHFGYFVGRLGDLWTMDFYHEDEPHIALLVVTND